MVKACLAVAGILMPPRRECSRILTYHSVGDRPHEMNTATEDFRRQMQWLADNRTLITLEKAARGATGVAVTFDDGYRDNLANAAPILCEYAVPATVFIVPGAMDGMLPHDRDPGSSRLLTWDEAIELAGLGLEIGGHTMSHARLSALTKARQQTEIEECAETIKKHIGEMPGAFAYPYGSVLDYTDLTKHLVKQCGFKYAVSNRYGVNTPGCDTFELKRIWIDASDTFESFKAKVTGQLDMLSLLDMPFFAKMRRFFNKLLHVK